MNDGPGEFHAKEGSHEHIEYHPNRQSKSCQDHGDQEADKENITAVDGTFHIDQLIQFVRFFRDPICGDNRQDDIEHDHDEDICNDLNGDQLQNNASPESQIVGGG